MWMNRLKNLLGVVLILGLGLVSGWALVKAPEWFKSPYQEGDYSRYFDQTEVSVVLYGTSTCPFCHETKAMLDKMKVAYIEHDINRSEKGKKDFAELKADAVPLLLIGNRRIEGFQKEVIEDALLALRPGLASK